jgi:hypothetical protein
MVCNLLAAIGSAPRFGRPNFPQPAKKYYPWDFDLISFSDEALYRFVCFELPKGEPSPPPRKSEMMLTNLMAVAPKPIFFEHVGELYALIRNGFFAMEEEKLFIGPKFAQDVDEWTITLANLVGYCNYRMVWSVVLAAAPKLIDPAHVLSKKVTAKLGPLMFGWSHGIQTDFVAIRADICGPSGSD